MKKTTLLLLILLSVFFTNCTNHPLTEQQAYEAVEHYLEHNPVYESAGFIMGKMLLRKSKDQALIKTYLDLQQQGYMTISHQDNHKKRLATDTIWTANITLTSKADPYVVKLRNDRLLIKTILYKVTKDSDLQIISKNKRTATISILLFKEKSPFYNFKLEKPSRDIYIEKKYKLRFNTQQTWEVIP